jgi:hypothetical protein
MGKGFFVLMSKYSLELAISVIYKITMGNHVQNLLMNILF